MRKALTASTALPSLLTACLLVAPACGGDGASGDRSESPSGGERAKEMKRPVSGEGKSWGGWRWKGKRGDCFFIYDNRCFDQLAAACKAAQCDKSDCEHDDSAPAKVTCEED